MNLGTLSKMPLYNDPSDGGYQEGQTSIMDLIFGKNKKK